MSSQCTEGERNVFPVDKSYIPDALRKQAESEFSEDNETRVNGLKLLRSMLKGEADLRWQDDDLFLLAYLRARKFDSKRAFTVMKNFYSAVGKYDELYNNFNFNLVKSTMEHINIGLLPYRDDEGCVTLLLKVDPWNPHEDSLGDVMRAMTCLLLVAVLSPATQIAGLKLIIDFAGFSMKRLPYVSPTYLLLAASALQNCFPGRFRAVHVVNQNYLFSSIWTVLKQFLSKKMRARWHFHGKNVKYLHKFYPPSILPAEYEGDLPPFDNTSLTEVEKYADYLKHVFSFGFLKYRTSTERKNSFGNPILILRRLSQTLLADRKNSTGNCSRTEKT